MRLITLLLGLALVAPSAQAATPSETLQTMFSAVPPGSAPSGVLYDRVLPLSRLDDLDGMPGAPAVSIRRWRQALHEIRRASDNPSRLPDLEPAGRSSDVSVVILDHGYDRLRQDAFALGLASMDGEQISIDPGALEPFRVFTVAPLRGTTYRGEVRFRFDPGHYFSDRESRPELRFDAADGNGLRAIPADGIIRVNYTSPGTKMIRVEAGFDDGSTLRASSQFVVESLMAPAPDDTLQVVASIQHEGLASTGEAYLYYAPGHSSLVRPILLIEGFDLDDTMNWDEVYAMLNEANLIEDVRQAGYDIVVLNFDDATTDIQRNGYLVVELIQQVQQRIDPRASFSLAGASMGGLCSRFALAYMEQNGIEHRINTFISFDAPHGGANIPLGMQYWLGFFSGESADAAFLLSRLDRPAARQLLVYHHTTPPSSTPGADALRGSFLADLDALGNYPDEPRLVSIANGSGSSQDQGFAPGAQIIRWEYDSFLVDIRGNVWSVNDGANQQIFQGEINPFLLPATTQNVTVSGTSPFDGAPGGSRASMADADATEAPYGDIVALHPSHCFIPTTSALDLPTTDLFYDVDGTADLVSLTPFDAIYFPVENQEHVAITAENAAWFKAELFASPTATPPTARTTAVMHPNVPNPFNPRTTIRLEILDSAPVRLDIYDLRGRRVTTLLDEVLDAGERWVEWDGSDDSGAQVASGVYVARLSHGEITVTQRMALVR